VVATSADRGGAIGIRVVSGCEPFLEHHGVQPALDSADSALFDGISGGILRVTVQGQYHVAAVDYQIGNPD